MFFTYDIPNRINIEKHYYHNNNKQFYLHCTLDLIKGWVYRSKRLLSIDKPL